MQRERYIYTYIELFIESAKYVYESMNSMNSN